MKNVNTRIKPLDYIVVYWKFAPSSLLSASCINQLSHWWWRWALRKEDDHAGVYYEAGPRNRLGLSSSSTAASCFHLTFSSRAGTQLQRCVMCDVWFIFLPSLSTVPWQIWILESPHLLTTIFSLSRFILEVFFRPTSARTMVLLHNVQIQACQAEGPPILFAQMSKVWIVAHIYNRTPFNSSMVGKFAYSNHGIW